MTVPLTDIILEKHINKYLVIGFDMKGNLLEIMYNLVDSIIWWTKIPPTFSMP